MKYVRPYKKWFIVGPLCMIVEVIGEVLMPKFLAKLINLPAVTSYLVDDADLADKRRILGDAREASAR